MNTDMATFTGAYVANALSETERVAFERHMASCADCAEEVRQLEETTAFLGRTTAVDPPGELKQRVLAEVAHTRQESPATAERPRRRGSHGPRGDRDANRRASWGTRLATAAAIVGVVLAAGFGALAWNTQQELQQARADRDAAVERLVRAPDAKVATTSARGMEAVTVMSERMDKVMFLGSGMEPAPPERVYQLWFLGDYGAKSAGLLRQVPSGNMSAMMAEIPPETRAIGITVEPAGGSEHPSTDPLLEMSMPT
ncbi:Anti-sigma-K factor RskA [Actinopolyspora mzabensis]|uniref:Regulator of SigK n=1 Tax=Actinopolyspora mzabensis TaxID=995066 RepID=A0A1G9FD11_ACTMZ|nr:anti-sigma factor [Actinopolyspora mzabensis]SDK86237.1 Anti-sigma-K factor RskA [Actinopolyspora mzabensis]